MSSQARQPVHRTTAGRTFSLGTLLLFVTLISVWLGLFIVAPWLAILLLLLFGPTLIRATASIRKYQMLGAIATWRRKLQHVLTSFVIVAIIYAIMLAVWLFADGILTTMFVATTLAARTGGQPAAGGPQGVMWSFHWAIGSIAAAMAIGAGLHMFWLTWPWESDFSDPAEAKPTYNESQDEPEI